MALFVIVLELADTATKTFGDFLCYSLVSATFQSILFRVKFSFTPDTGIQAVSVPLYELISNSL